MKDLIVGAVRTGVQSLVALIVTALAGIGIAVDAISLENVLTALGVGITTLLLNWLSTKIPFLAKFLSLGLSDANPEYVVPAKES